MPDIAIDALDLDFATIRAASCRGRSHRFGAKLRQDAYALSVDTRSRCVVLAVADGVSAGSHSHLAAEIAVRCATREVLRTVIAGKSPDWEDVVARASDLIIERGRRFGAPEADIPSHMATTLAVAAVQWSADSNSAKGDGCYVGDSSLWKLSNGMFASLMPIKNAGAVVASSQVAALPIHRTAHTVPIDLSPGDALFLMSDGVGDALGDGVGEVGEHLAHLWRRPPWPYQFARHVDFRRRTFDDDRTAVGLWLPEGV